LPVGDLPKTKNEIAFTNNLRDDDEECCLRCHFLVGTVIPVASAPTPFPLLSTKSVRESHVVVESHSPAIESVAYLRSQVFLTPELARMSVARLSIALSCSCAPRRSLSGQQGQKSISSSPQPRSTHSTPLLPPLLGERSGGEGESKVDADEFLAIRTNARSKPNRPRFIFGSPSEAPGCFYKWAQRYT